MDIWRTAFVSSALLLAASPALAGTNCWTIQDPNQRAYCRAIATSSQGQCSFISDHALRQTCRARLGANPDSVCNTAGSSWERHKCRDAARPR